MAFQDHFSGQAPAYAEFRPTYPANLVNYLADLAPGRRLAWDCGTGNGQAAVLLANRFEHVLASDPSRQQLHSRLPNAKVAYVAAAAERAPLADGSVDLVTVAQAIHWFDLPRFYGEVRRVARPGGIVAAWCYELAQITPAVDRWVLHYYCRVVGPYWPPERRLVEQGYRGMPFQFQEIESPAFTMEAQWSLEDLIGYLSTWSATQRACKSLGYDVLERAVHHANGEAGSLAEAWGDAPRRHIVWPLGLRVGRA